MTGSVEESIVLTGCGWVTPSCAGSISEVVTAARAAVSAKERVRTEGRSANGREGFEAIPDEFRDAFPGFSKELKADKGAWIAAAALEHALRGASLLPGSLEPTRVGLVLGCGLAGQLGMLDFADEVRAQSARFVSPIHFPQTVGNYYAGALARSYEIRGPSVTIASGSASGLDAITEARALLVHEEADAVIAGGMERMSAALAEGLGGEGIVSSEGACLFVLERAGQAAARGAAPLAVVTRCGHAHQRAEDVSTPEPSAGAAGGNSPIISTAGLVCCGAIFIEHWIGRCIGAAGAAAVAAAIAAAQGREVPFVDPADPGIVTVGRLEVDQGSTDKGLRAVILADADDAHRSFVELAFSVPG